MLFAVMGKSQIVSHDAKSLTFGKENPNRMPRFDFARQWS